MTLTGAVVSGGSIDLPGASALVQHGLTDLRSHALRIVGAGLAAADPRAGLEREVRREGADLVVGERRYDLSTIDRVVLLGAGKATLPIARGLAQLLGTRLSAGLIVVQRGAAAPVAGVDVREADHPVPSVASLEAGAALLGLAAEAGPDDLVITAFTGGSSALACAPPPGVSFAAKQELHRLLLASGAPIEQINAVRKHVSTIKGGRLARVAAPARIVNLTLPDVASGRLDCITDPTVTDSSTVAEAVAVLRGRGLWDVIDPAIRALLTEADGTAAKSPDLDDVDIHTVLLTDGERALTAMSEASSRLGLTPHVFGTRLEGEAATLGRLLATLACESASRGRPFAAPCALLGAGGESVVTMTSLLGKPSPAGGPNQETALGFAQALPATDDPPPIAAVFFDSDGSDGGTPYAGAIVDGATPARAVDAGVDLDTALLAHESSAAFGRLDDLLVTGATHTNISDLWAVVIAPAATA